MSLASTEENEICCSPVAAAGEELTSEQTAASRDKNSVASISKIKFEDLCMMESATLRCRTPSYFQLGYALNSTLR